MLSGRTEQKVDKVHRDQPKWFCTRSEYEYAERDLTQHQIIWIGVIYSLEFINDKMLNEKNIYIETKSSRHETTSTSEYC